jgi:hypothetical protein
MGESLETRAGDFYATIEERSLLLSKRLLPLVYFSGGSGGVCRCPIKLCPWPEGAAIEAGVGEVTVSHSGIWEGRNVTFVQSIFFNPDDHGHGIRTCTLSVISAEEAGKKDWNQRIGVVVSDTLPPQVISFDNRGKSVVPNLAVPDGDDGRWDFCNRTLDVLEQAANIVLIRERVVNDFSVMVNDVCVDRAS